MGTNRRGFLRILGIGSIGAVAPVPPTVAASATNAAASTPASILAVPSMAKLLEIKKVFNACFFKNDENLKARKKAFDAAMVAKDALEEMGLNDEVRQTLFDIRPPYYREFSDVVREYKSRKRSKREWARRKAKEEAAKLPLRWLRKISPSAANVVNATRREGIADRAELKARKAVIEVYVAIQKAKKATDRAVAARDKADKARAKVNGEEWVGEVLDVVNAVDVAQRRATTFGKMDVNSFVRRYSHHLNDAPKPYEIDWTDANFD